MNNNECNELATISLDDLEDVNGGGVVRVAQRVYKWWTHEKLLTPKAAFDEVVHVIKQVGTVTGIGAVGKWAYDWWKGKGSTPQPPAGQE